MKSFIAFSKKEFIEYLRTYKLFISIMIFLILGFLNPISAKYLPEIVSLVMPEGVMNIPTPTVLDSWTILQECSANGINYFLNCIWWNCGQ